MTTQREAELELEVMRLREALETCKSRTHFDLQEEPVTSYYFDVKKVIKALSTHSSTTALSALIERVEKMTIERCVKECEARYADLLEPEIREMEQAIRSLPTGKIDIQEAMK